MEDVVNHPSHYEGKIECIEVLGIVTEDLVGIEAISTANAVKYLWRWKKKNGIQDLQKAVWYINHLIDILEARDIEDMNEREQRMAPSNDTGLLTAEARNGRMV